MPVLPFRGKYGVFNLCYAVPASAGGVRTFKFSLCPPHPKKRLPFTPSPPPPILLEDVSTWIMHLCDIFFSPPIGQRKLSIGIFFLFFCYYIGGGVFLFYSPPFPFLLFPSLPPLLIPQRFFYLPFPFPLSPLPCFLKVTRLVSSDELSFSMFRFSMQK